MKTYYSGSTGGFYREDVHGTAIPPDAVQISEEDWHALLNAQSAGMAIQPDENGRPAAVHRSQAAP